ncbi:hypothetical protein HG531_001794 [Fusarium graminearum]|nr:hypothetical protein HG531_001794 [Fusarium graminearum]
MPQLACWVLALAVVENVLKFGVSTTQFGLELDLVAHRVEVKGLARTKDDGLFGEVAKALGSILRQDLGPLLPSTLVRLHSTITRGPSRNVEASLAVANDGGGSEAIAEAGKVPDALAARRSMVKELSKKLGHDWGIHVDFFLSISASKAAGTSNTLLKLLDLNNLGCVDALEDELGNAVALLDLKVGVVVVEEKDLDLATVIGINDTSTCVDEVLGGET